MKSIGVLKTCEFKTNAQNARALELMIPCHNNAAKCYIKRKNYGDARLLCENVRERDRRERGGVAVQALGSSTFPKPSVCHMRHSSFLSCFFRAAHARPLLAL